MVTAACLQNRSLQKDSDFSRQKIICRLECWTGRCYGFPSNSKILCDLESEKICKSCQILALARQFWTARSPVKFWVENAILCVWKPTTKIPSTSRLFSKISKCSKLNKFILNFRHFSREIAVQSSRAEEPSYFHDFLFALNFRNFLVKY